VKRRIGRREVNVSNPDKVFFPKRKLKKGLRLTRLPARGRYTVAVTITLKDGVVLKGKRRYRGCG